MTVVSNIVTQTSVSESLAGEADLALFEALVREYCGVGFFECLDCPESGYLTSAVWGESGSRPPALYRAVVELLHRAVEREGEQ
ncbi:hypothetical protein F8E02_07615 [Methanoculleus sp. Wushi-C6]|uniref:Uncharacterized protein n=1 Tax=Methanoculleus caldifontis TaxID=2651577 RepID=A0ABU3X2R2_9EURY|nr:hypothetical protein [Methanoculleus sp. Wushi-C6]MDV2481877.1 hypothetical protein [Methanoculleus sp. Wushi-C6]